MMIADYLSTSPIPLPLTDLFERGTVAGPCLHRELNLSHQDDDVRNAFFLSWRAEKEKWLRLGYSVRKIGEEWVLLQWLRLDGSLTQIGAVKLAEHMATLPQAGRPTLHLSSAEPFVMRREKPNGYADPIAKEPEQNGPEVFEFPTQDDYEPTAVLEPIIEAKLFPYQVKPARIIIDALNRNGGAFDCSDMGVGKTFQGLAAAACTYRNIGVICPLAIRSGWMKAFRHFGLDHLFVLNYEKLRGGKTRWFSTKEGWMNLDPKETVLIFDEAHRCLPWGALISTTEGLLPIGSIVDNKMDVSVFSYDEHTTRIVTRPVVNHFRNPKRPTVVVRHSRGFLDCTVDHKIYTSHGWKEAGQIRPGDLLLVLDPVRSEEQPGAEVLPQIMLGKMAELSAGNQGGAESDPSAHWSSTATNNRSHAGGVIEAHEGVESDGEVGNPGEDADEPEGSEIQGPRREWLLDRASEDTRRTHTGFGHGAPGRAVGRDARTVHQSAEVLEVGYCLAEQKDSGGSGRSFPQDKIGSGVGREEGCYPSASWVACVSIHESASSERSGEMRTSDHLYDIEVAGTHCYFANETLVHNCKNPDTANAKLLRWAIDQGIWSIAMSGTMATAPWELAVTGELIGLHEGGSSFGRFVAKHGGVFNQYLGKHTFKNQDAKSKGMASLHRKIFPGRGTRVSIEELGDLFPETQIHAEAFDIDEAARKIIDKAFEDAEKKIEMLRRKEGDAVANQSKNGTFIQAWHTAELAKVPAMCAIADEHLENGRSLAIFCNFNDVREAVMAHYKTKCGIFGGQHPDERNRCIEAFQSDRERVIVCNLTAGGVGVSLHDEHGNYPRTSILFPNPRAADFKQGLGRVHRAGGRSKSQQIVFFAADTVEQAICEIIRDKLQGLDSLNDGDFNPAHTF